MSAENYIESTTELDLDGPITVSRIRLCTDGEVGWLELDVDDANEPLFIRVEHCDDSVHPVFAALDDVLVPVATWGDDEAVSQDG